MFKNYLKMAFRNIRRYKGYALINIAGLTVGMACFILIFLWTYDELNYDTFHTHSNLLYRLILKKADDPGDPGVPSTPYILPKILKEEKVNWNGHPGTSVQVELEAQFHRGKWSVDEYLKQNPQAG